MTERPFDHIRKNSIAIRVSREMLLDLGLTDPTPAEAEQREANLIRYREWKRRRDHQEVAMLTALAERTDPVTVAVLALHSPETEALVNDPACQGCDIDGYEAEAPEWPCRTVRTLAEAHGIPTPEEHM